MRNWRVALDALSFRAPLHGLELPRWRQVLGDAHWLLDHYADRAARDGWTGGDLFGLLPEHDGWGGVADRLRSSRSLVMTADTARWRRLITDTPDQYSRGELPGIKPLWETR
ncbi:hypothetical protein ACFO0A_00625 [Novosphingobium tardum]|uniref:Uncharacterized protein n=1 Tax=Novosphingobium tardum TaxID=1538021 RepID=A0ABV8RKX3_9SPHN